MAQKKTVPLEPVAVAKVHTYPDLLYVEEPKDASSPFEGYDSLEPLSESEVAIAVYSLVKVCHIRRNVKYVLEDVDV